MSRYNPVASDILIRYNLGAIEILFSEQLVRAIMKSEYLKLADTIATEIAAGTLKAGDRLPPQRNFAWERKIAVSTASRVYSELLRRGLVVGEVGRGTFISGDAKRGVTAPNEISGVRIDLEFNYPLRPDQTAMIAKSIDGLQTATALESALRPATTIGTPAFRSVAAAHLSQGPWSPLPDQFVFTGNGRQSIAAALASVVPAGGRCGVEPLTYPFVKGIAARLGISLVPLAMDADGVRPDSVQRAHREGHLSAIYIQPVVQNPLGMTMPPARRADLLRVVEKLDIPVIEDNVYGFLDHEIAPLAALAPDRCIVIDSLSKKVAPGLALGFVVPPRRLRETVMAVGAFGWMDGVRVCLCRRAADAGRRHRRRAIAIEAHRRARAPEARDRASRGLRHPDQRQVLSFVADAAGALALADFRCGRGQARHCADALDDVRHHARPRAECGAARACGPDHGSTRRRPAHAGGDAQRRRGRFRLDGMSGSITSAYLPLSDRLMRVTIPSQARSSCAG